MESTDSDAPVPKIKKMKAVPRPDNPFNDPWTVGVVGGTIAGLIGGFVFTAGAIPLLKRLTNVVAQGPCKFAILVREDLKMSKGKIASQCSHATASMHSTLSNSVLKYREGRGIVDAWHYGGQPIIVLKAPSMTTVDHCMQKAKKLDIPVFPIRDAGRTEVAPGSLTVVGLGPTNKHSLDEIIRDLKTL